MDIQGRTGMPDLVPWSNALNPTLSAQGRINEFASIAGATGGLIEKGYDATQLIARDEYRNSRINTHASLINKFDYWRQNGRNR